MLHKQNFFLKYEKIFINIGKFIFLPNIEKNYLENFIKKRQKERKANVSATLGPFSVP